MLVLLLNPAGRAWSTTGFSFSPGPRSIVRSLVVPFPLFAAPKLGEGGSAFQVSLPGRSRTEAGAFQLLPGPDFSL